MRIGELIRPLRAGDKGLAVERIGCPRTMVLRSDAFAHEGALPREVSVEGGGVPPGLSWEGVPADTAELVLIVQDTDAPFFTPIVHAVVHGIEPGASGLAAGAWARSGTFGSNTMGKRAFLAPAPVPGHGVHRYVFQLFALSRAVSFARPPRLSGAIAAIKGHALACGVLVGTYERP